MNKKHFQLLALILSVISIFIIGVIYEIDYRILTRKTIKYFSNVEIDYYGKDFRIFETDIAFILTLIPISIFMLVKKLTSFKTKVKLAMLFFITIIVFYFLCCYVESCIIGITIARPRYINGVLMYHYNIVDYKGILFVTIVLSFAVGILIKKLIKKSDSANLNMSEAN